MGTIEYAILSGLKNKRGIRMISGKRDKLRGDLVIFDLDGTLIDSSRDIAWSANMVLYSMGYDRLDMEVIKESIGWGVKNLLEKLMPEETPESIDAARLKFLAFYGGHLVVETTIYPGVVEIMEYLKAGGRKMAIVTNKPHALSVAILDELRLSRYFSAVLGGDSLPNRKPHPEPVMKVLSLLGVAPSASVIVGDSPVDCEAGRSARVGTVGVTYGFRGREELEGAGCDFIIDSILELKGCVD